MTELLPTDLLPDGLTPTVLLLVLVAALAARWIDAVVGGSSWSSPRSSAASAGTCGPRTSGPSSG